MLKNSKQSVTEYKNRLYEYLSFKGGGGAAAFDLLIGICEQLLKVARKELLEYVIKMQWGYLNILNTRSGLLLVIWRRLKKLNINRRLVRSWSKDQDKPNASKCQDILTHLKIAINTICLICAVPTNSISAFFFFAKVNRYRSQFSTDKSVLNQQNDVTNEFCSTFLVYKMGNNKLQYDLEKVQYFSQSENSNSFTHIQITGDQTDFFFTKITSHRLKFAIYVYVLIILYFNF